MIKVYSNFDKLYEMFWYHPTGDFTLPEKYLNIANSLQYKRYKFTNSYVNRLGAFFFVTPDKYVCLQPMNEAKVMHFAYHRLGLNEKTICSVNMEESYMPLNEVLVNLGLNSPVIYTTKFFNNAFLIADSNSEEATVVWYYPERE